MGERDAYRRLDLRLRIDQAGRPLLIERARLQPARHPLAVPGRHGRFDCVGTLVLVGFTGAARDLGPAGTDAKVWWGSGGDGEMTLVRLLGPSAQTVRDRAGALLRRAIAYSPPA